MVKLKSLKVNASALREGEWIPLGREFGNAQVLIRGFTHEYFDKLAFFRDQAAKKERVPVAKLGNEAATAANREAIKKYLLIDIKDFFDDDGAVITIDQFKELMEDPDYTFAITRACIEAAGLVGQLRDEAKVEALGN